MIEDMYGVMQRINDIQKRFGLKRHNQVQPEQTQNKTDDASSVFQRLLEESRGPNGEVLTNRQRIDRVAEYYAHQKNVPPALVKAVINTESGYDETAVSPKGAMGLMQLMPGTASDLGVKDPFSVNENIRGGVTMLSDLLKKYNGNYELALAAYNAGPTTVDRYGGVPNYRETKQYIKKVLDSYEANK